MTDAAHRVFKDRLYGQFALIGKAVASPQRLELLELLAQGARTVEAISKESELSIANASQHLQVLRQAGLVESQKHGLFVEYRLAGPEIIAADITEKETTRDAVEQAIAKLGWARRRHREEGPAARPGRPAHHRPASPHHPGRARTA